MAPAITWLHLSDLHACNPLTGWDADDVLADLRADLVRLREAHGLSPDLVFFTGDAGFGHLGSGRDKSLAGQLDKAEGFFRGVRETCGVDQDRFFLVPGNHDVHRGKVNPSDTAWLDSRIGQADDADVVALLKQGDTQWESVLGRLGEYRAFLERHGYDHLLDDPGRLLFTSVREVSGVKLGVAGFNTAWSCCRSPERGKLWWGGRWQVKELAGKLADCDLCVALTHHPGGWFTQAEDPAVDDVLKRRFDPRLHGHEHRGWIELVSRVTGERDHLRISAGASYAASEKEKGYNFGRLDLAEGTVEVFLRRYDETGEGWVAHELAHRTKSDGRWRSEPLRQLASAPKMRTAPKTLLSSTPVRDSGLAANVEQRHDRLARDLLAAQRGREIDKTDSFLMLFDRPIDALRYAVTYHDALGQLGEDLGVELAARVGIHHGEVIEWENPLGAAQPVKVAEAARQVTAKVTALAGPRQTLLTWTAFQIASRGAVGQPEAQTLSWRPHGRYTFQGGGDPVEIFEAGRPGTAPLVPPAEDGKAKRLDQPHDERSQRLARELAEARARRDVLVARLHVPEALRAVLRQAIAWELEERFSSMAELGAALRQAMAAGASPELPAEAGLRIEAGMHGAVIRRVDVDVAGRFLVTGSDDKTARVWDLQRGELLRVLRPPIGEGDEGKVFAVALTPDGEVVAVGGYTSPNGLDTNVYLFERRSGRLLRRIADLPNAVSHLVFSFDGLRLAAMLGGANGLRVFRVTDGEELHRDTDYGASSYGASFDAAGRLVTACWDGRPPITSGSPWCRHRAATNPLPWPFLPRPGALPWSTRAAHGWTWSRATI